MRLTQRGAQCLQATAVAVDSDDREGPLEQTECHRLSDAVGRTGDHRDPLDFFVGVLQIPFIPCHSD